jgi:hypothetical protein
MRAVKSGARTLGRGAAPPRQVSAEAADGEEPRRRAALHAFSFFLSVIIHGLVSSCRAVHVVRTLRVPKNAGLSASVTPRPLLATSRGTSTSSSTARLQLELVRVSLLAVVVRVGVAPREEPPVQSRH